MKNCQAKKIHIYIKNKIKLKKKRKIKIKKERKENKYNKQKIIFVVFWFFFVTGIICVGVKPQRQD